MLDQLQKAEQMLRPLVAQAEAYKAVNGRKAGTILSKVRNAHLRCKEAIAVINSVVQEAATLDTASSVQTLTESKSKG